MREVNLERFYSWLERWAIKPAKWYHFWRPQSGAAGGLLFSAMIVIVVAILLKIS